MAYISTDLAKDLVKRKSKPKPRKIPTDMQGRPSVARGNLSALDARLTPTRDPNRPLSPERERLLALMLRQEVSAEEAAEILGCGISQARRSLNDPRLLHRLRHMMDHRLRLAAGVALDVLIKHLSSDDEAVQYRAANCILMRAEARAEIDKPTIQPLQTQGPVLPSFQLVIQHPGDLPPTLINPPPGRPVIADLDIELPDIDAYAEGLPE